MIISLTLLLCSLALTTAFDYPSVRRNESVADDYFGTIVKDPYRWLEDPDSNETKKFVSDQNKLFHNYVDKSPLRKKIEKDFENYLNYPKYGIPSKRGSRYYFTINTGLQDHSVYYYVHSLDTNEVPKLFLDPSQLNMNGTTSLNFIKFSPNGKYCAYGLSEGGSDWVSVKIKNTDTLEDLPEKLIKLKFSAASWTPDNLGFFYAQFDTYNGTAGGNATEVPQNQKLFYHRVKTNQTQDIKIVEFPKNPLRILGIPAVCETGKYIHLFPFGDGPDSWFFAPLELPVRRSLNFTRMAQKGRYSYVAGDGDLVYMKTNFLAPKNRLIRVNLTDCDSRKWVDILAEHPTNILSDVTALNNNSVVAVYVKNVSHVLQIHSLTDGQYLKKIDTQKGINIQYLRAERNGGELIYKRSGFLLPEVIYRVNVNTNDKMCFKQSLVKNLNLSHFEVKQAFVLSKDRTVYVPMYIVHMKDMKMDGTNPTLIYAYGGFGSNIMPNFNALHIFFINNLRGVFAQVNARGGGYTTHFTTISHTCFREYGEEWHSSATRTRKQNTFDDMISAAEYLIRNKYTRRDRIVIKGQSNGGLTVGAAANQRADLFGAVIAGVGVMDMLRFGNFTIGYSWKAEYGDPAHNQTEFRYIYRYSPLHAMPAKTIVYPATLALTADHDDRVVPAHSFKYMAQMQHLLGPQVPHTPLMIRVATGSGHGGGKPLTKWIEEYADIATFILNTLNLKYYSAS